MERAEVEYQLIQAFHARRSELLSRWRSEYSNLRSWAYSEHRGAIRRQMARYGDAIQSCHDAQVAMLDMLGESK